MPAFSVRMTALRETTVRAPERADAMRIAKALAVLPEPFDPASTRLIKTRVEPTAPGIADLVYDHEAQDAYHRYEFLLDAAPPARNAATFVLISGMAEISRIRVTGPESVLLHFLPQWKRLWRLQLVPAAFDTTSPGSGLAPPPLRTASKSDPLFTCRTLVEATAKLEADDTRAAAATVEGMLPDKWSVLVSSVTRLNSAGVPNLIRFYADNFESVDTRTARVYYSKTPGPDGAFHLLQGWNTPEGFAALPPLRFPLDPANAEILPSLIPHLEAAWTRGFVSDPHRRASV